VEKLLKENNMTKRSYAPSTNARQEAYTHTFRKSSLMPLPSMQIQQKVIAVGWKTLAKHISPQQTRVEVDAKSKRVVIYQMSSLRHLRDKAAS